MAMHTLMNRASRLTIGVMALAFVQAHVRGQASAPSAEAPPRKVEWPARATEGLAALAAQAPKSIAFGDVALPIRRVTPRGLGLILETLTIGEQDEDDGRVSDFLFVSVRPGQAVATLDERLAREGVQWRLHEPTKAPPKGLIVHLGGNKYVRQALLAKGWIVLHSSGTGRYFHESAFEAPLVIDPAGIDDAAQRLAAAIDDSVADWPYSLEAVLAHLAETRPELPLRPAALMGFSIGALGLPAVAQRMPDRFAAILMVGGGENLLRISQESALTNAGVALQWTRDPTDAERERLFAAYLDHAGLDPRWGVDALRGRPIRVYLAKLDNVTPYESGQALARRFGDGAKVDEYPFGHKQLLRWHMRMQANDVVEWVARELAPGESPPP